MVALGGLLAGALLAAAVAAAAWPASADAASSKTASGSAKTAPPSASGPTLAPDPVNETLRPKEIVLPSQSPYTSGKIIVQPLRLTCGLSEIVGTHDRYEFDIYYDVPREATVNGFTFADGEGGPTVRAPLPVRVWPFL
ncbi:hypothetical protein Caci_5680 [Catenulispora acidiphila DSM 44928]|uniref:Uncharacterized protein n=1 Tax=Catenulispora acidiphila (strain DSM 44928 / JCM 14897 / NBRC 102108 / NRRL B-24433 / ID139908) TaxID=479433 RepID=C7QC90_CATAD|nr:hypothetical protein Caci_5680 [Catenulispora acidiphila DSM 44928]